MRVDVSWGPSRIALVFAALVVALLLAAPAHAKPRQERKWAETVEGAVIGGYADIDVTGANEDVDRDAGWFVGFLIGYNFNDWLGVQFEYRSARTRASSDAPGLPAGDCVTSTCDVSNHAFGLAGVYNLQGGRYFVHYAKISAGGYTSVADEFTASGGYVGFGVGTRFFPFRVNPLHLRVGADIDGQFPGNAAVQGQDVSTHSTLNVRVSVGVGYLFD